MRIPTPSTLRMEDMNFDGAMSPALSVVALDLVTIDGFFEKTPNPNLFFLASTNLGDEIHFKCGSL